MGALDLIGRNRDQIEGHAWEEFCSPSNEAKSFLEEVPVDSEPTYFQTNLVDEKGEKHPLVLSRSRLGMPDKDQTQYLLFGYDMEDSPDRTLWEDTTQLATRVTQLQESLAIVNRRFGETALELAEEQQKMKAVMASLGEGMLVLDTAHRITQVGGTAEELLGRNKVELIGRQLSQVLPELFRAIGTSLIHQNGALTPKLEELVRDVRFEYQNKILRANLAPTMDSEKQHLGTVIIFEDFTHITEIDRMKSELISIVSHELRTPLSSIKGYVDLIIEGEAGPLSEVGNEYLNIVKSNAERLVEMVDVMLDIERIESGRLQLQCEQMDLAYAGHYVASTFRGLADEKQIDFQLEIPQGMEIRADLDRIIQILSNLIGNAIKYTPREGKVQVLAEADRHNVRIKVIDTGMGVLPAEQPRLFEKFYRASGSSKIKGTGLGLSITKSLVEAHGGSIEVESQPNQGSTFTVILPKTGPA